MNFVEVSDQSLLQLTSLCKPSIHHRFCDYAPVPFLELFVFEEAGEQCERRSTLFSESVFDDLCHDLPEGIYVLSVIAL
jgi:hypothetical protein